MSGVENSGKVFWEWAAATLRGLFEDKLAWVTGSIWFLLFLVVVLLIYTSLLRLTRHCQERRKQARFKLWNELVPAYLSEAATGEHLARIIRPRDFRIFGDFVRPFLLDLTGEDRERLNVLLEKLNYEKYLQRLAAHRQDSHRAKAVHFLGLINARAAIPLIRKKLFDRSELVQFAAAEALMQVQDIESVSVILSHMGETFHDKQERISAILFEFGPNILPELFRILKERRVLPWVMILIIGVLKHFLYHEATWELLLLATGHADREIRIAALGALERFQEPTLVGLFEDLLRENDAVVSALAARGLGKIGGPEHLTVLQDLLRHNSFWVLKEAVYALKKIGEGGVAALKKQATNPELTDVARSLIREALAAS